MSLLYTLEQFLHQGGLALYLIALCSFVLWALVFERILYLFFYSSDIGRGHNATWQNFRDHVHAADIRNAIKSEYQQQLSATFPMIQTLVRITPLLGLFGTVFGMIELFEVVARQGTGDARAMASGISRITLPTMSGMAVAIVGLFFSRLIESMVKKRINLLSLELQN